MILGSDEIKRDRDGDIPIRFGSAVTFVRAREGEMPGVEIFSPLLKDMPVTPKLYETLNQVNLEFGLGKVVLTPSGEIVLSTLLLAETLTHAELATGLQAVSAAADFFDTKLKERLGGETWFEDEGESFDV
jgi:hypothetical protein